MPVPFPDAVQEFSVEASGLSASQAKSSGVSMVTKSGTNTFHGSGFEFLRDDAFNAKPYFATTAATLKRNQFGGTVGGPLLQNRLFFFGGYQGTLDRTAPASVRTFVPTAAMLAGDFTAFAACSRLNSTRGGFVNNQIDPSRFVAPALEIIRRVNLVSTNPCGEVFYQSRSASDEHQFVARGDFQMSADHSLFGRAVINRYTQPHGGELNPTESILAHNAGGFDNWIGSYGFGSTYVISSAAVNQFRVSVNKVSSNLTSGDGFTFCAIGVQMQCPRGVQSFTNITGAFTLGTRLPQGDFWHATTWGVSNDMALLKGSHQLNLGVQIQQGRQDEIVTQFGVGSMFFTGTATGSPMGDFLTGQVSQFQMAGLIEQNPTQYLVGVYAADSWTATPRITVNYGVRWDPELTQQMRNGHVYNFDYAQFQAGTRSTVYPNAPPGLSYPGDPGFAGLSGSETHWLRFSPRAGIAWDLNGDGRSSLRSSYSRTYEVMTGLFKEDWVVAAPWGNLSFLNSVPMVAPWSTAQTPKGDPFPLTLGKDAAFNPGLAYLTAPADVRMPVTDSWNVSYQRQLGQWVASASYLGSHVSNIWAQEMINPAVFVPGVGDASGRCFLNGAAVVTVAPGAACSTTGNTELRRRFRFERPQDGGNFGAVSQVSNDAQMDYRGLVLALQRRVGNIVVTGNHTWSRCFGDDADLNSGGPDINQTNTDPTNLHFDRGYCNSDRRHVFNGTVVVRAPDFEGAALRALASNWSLAGIYRISSGAPLTVTTGQDNALVGTNGQRANLIEGRDPYGDRSGRPGTLYLDRTAFAVPAPGTFGNLERNSLRGLKTWSFDLALSRNFTVTQSQRIEFRVEAYNVTNSFRPVNPATGLNSGTFGLIRDSSASRILQFALKYVF